MSRPPWEEPGLSIEERADRVLDALDRFDQVGYGDTRDEVMRAALRAAYQDGRDDDRADRGDLAASLEMSGRKIIEGLEEAVHLAQDRGRFPDPPMSGWAVDDVWRLYRVMVSPADYLRLRSEGLTVEEYETTLAIIRRELAHRGEILL